MRHFLAGVMICVAVTSVPALYAADPEGPDLLRALKSSDESTRLATIDALGQQGGEIDGAIPALIGQLEDESAVVRAHAAHALGQIGAAAKPAAEALAQRVFDHDATVRREATKAYRNIRPGPEVSIPLFSKLFEQADPEVRIHVMAAMAEEGKAVVPPLIKALGQKKAAYWACLVLAEIGPDAEPAVPALVKLLQSDKRPEVQREAIITLAAIGPKAVPAVPALITALDDTAPDDTASLLRGPAVFALGAIGPKAKAAEAKLKKLAGSKVSKPFLRTLTLWALARISPDNEQLVRKVVPQLVEGLKSPEPRIRAVAARALLSLDPDPRILKPVMRKAMEDAGPEALNGILDALAGLGKEAVPRLIEALKEKTVRPRAAAIIARIGPAAKAAVPALIEALGDKSAETRNEVLFALAAIGPDAKAAVPAVTKALKDPNMDVRYSACYALGKIGRVAMPAKTELQKSLAGADQFLSTASAWALAQIHPECPETAPKSVPVLVKALGEPDAITRLFAAESLGCLGPLAKDAIPALKKALKDDDKAVRDMAAKALKAIGR